MPLVSPAVQKASKMRAENCPVADPPKSNCSGDKIPFQGGLKENGNEDCVVLGQKQKAQ